jgi:hypothetical protein
MAIPGVLCLWIWIRSRPRESASACEKWSKPRSYRVAADWKLTMCQRSEHRTVVAQAWRRLDEVSEGHTHDRAAHGPALGWRGGWALNTAMRPNRTQRVQPLIGLERIEVVVGVHLVSSCCFASVAGAKHCRSINAMAMPAGMTMKAEDQVFDLIKRATGNPGMRKRNAGIAARPSYGFPCARIGVIAGMVGSDQQLRHTGK